MECGKEHSRRQTRRKRQRLEGGSDNGSPYWDAALPLRLVTWILPGLCRSECGNSVDDKHQWTLAVPFLMQKLGHREVKQLAQGHTDKWRCLGRLILEKALPSYQRSCAVIHHGWDLMTLLGLRGFFTKAGGDQSLWPCKSKCRIPFARAQGMPSGSHSSHWWVLFRHLAAG